MLTCRTVRAQNTAAASCSAAFSGCACARGTAFLDAVVLASIFVVLLGGLTVLGIFVLPVLVSVLVAGISAVPWRWRRTS